MYVPSLAINAATGGQNDRLTQTILCLRQQCGEIRIQHQIGERRIMGERLAHAIEQARADDAAATPDPRDGAEVQLPTVFGAGGRHHRGGQWSGFEPVGDQLARGVEFDHAPQAREYALLDMQRACTAHLDADFAVAEHFIDDRLRSL